MSKLDYQAALALLSDGKEQPVETMSEFEAWLKGQTTMFVLRRNEHSGRFCFNFARPGLRGFIHRMTGGCGNMKPEYWEGMNILMDALSGHSDDGSFQPKMSGLTLFGGTRMLYKRDPKIVRPGITEVFPGIAADCPEAVVLGIVARYSKMYPTNHGLVIGTSPEDDYFTIVHPNQKSIAVLQDNADEISPWEAEYLRCSDVVGELQEQAVEAVQVVARALLGVRHHRARGHDEGPIAGLREQQFARGLLERAFFKGRGVLNLALIRNLTL